MKIGGMYTIDFTRVSKIPKFNVSVKAGDSKRTISLILLENNIAINLDNYTVTVAAKKSDGTDIFNDVKIIDAKNGVCEVEVTKQMLATNLDLPCEIILYGADGTIASSSNFVISKISSVRNEESIVSSSEFTALSKALSEVKNIDHRFKEVDSQIKDIENQKLDHNEPNSITMGMLTTEVKKSMTDGNVAVVGTDSVGYVQLSKTIQSDITDLLDISSTTYNNYSADVVANKVSISESQYYKHQIFNVTEGETYDIELYAIGNINVKFIIFCDDLLNVTGTDVTNVSDGGLKSVTVTVPSASTKMYINTNSAKDITVVKHVYSPIATKKELNALDISQKLIQGKFKRDTKEELYSDKYDSIYTNVNGVATLGTSIYYKSVICKCVGLDKVYVNLSTISNPSVTFVYFTDDNLNIISSELSNQNTTEYTDYELTVPIGATKIVVNSNANHGYPFVKTYKVVNKCVDLDELKNIEKQINKNSNRIEMLEKAYSDIPAYYLDYIDKKVKEINTFERQYGCDGDTFIFITDIHVEDNTMQSPKIMQEIVKKTNVKKIICGGDLITAFPQTEERMYKQAYDYINSYRKIQGANVYTIPGNHDIMAFRGSTTTEGSWNVDDSERYSIVFKNQEDYVTSNNADLSNAYFYVDNKVQKIRYICTNMFSQNSVQPSNTQIDWIRDVALNGVDKTWSVMFFSHAGLTTVTGDGWSNTTAQAQSLKTLIENAQNTTNVIGHFAGHLHKDLHDLQNGVNHISIPCDAFYADDGIPRTRGTVNEICFDVVCVNKKTREINCVRIGAGNNREFSY